MMNIDKKKLIAEIRILVQKAQECKYIDDDDYEALGNFLGDPDVVLMLLNYIDTLERLVQCSHLDTQRVPLDDQQIKEQCTSCGHILWTGKSRI